VTRIAIDPVTRIGGHLRIEVEVANGGVTDAWSSGTMYRGIERILKGRDPRDAWLLAQRVCGVCTGAHALASVRAVENAVGVTIPKNARLIRNLIAGSASAQDHVVQFYQQGALDWVDAVSALAADPAATSKLARSLSDWPASSTSYFEATKARLATLVGSGQLGPFANGYWGHPAYRLLPEANLMVMAHYLEALDWQRRISRIHTLLGGKNPHPQTYLVGGMALTPPWGGPVRALAGEHPMLPERNAPIALSADGLSDLAKLVAELRTFVDQVYVPDALAIAGFYHEWSAIGRGTADYLSYGEFPEDDSPEPVLLLPRGRIVGGVLRGVQPVDEAAIAETVASSHYTYEGGDFMLKHPSEGRTEPRYGGPPLPFTSLEGAAKYSWLKAPRYDGSPMEVGPLARVLVAYAEGRHDVRARVNEFVAKLGVGPEALFSTMGRVAARAIEAQVLAARLRGWLDELRENLAAGDLAVADLSRWDLAGWPSEARGWSLGETPRGALGHWLTIKDGKIDSYQLVDGSTWNGSPRDGNGRRGPWEEALVGTPVADPDRPVEILRTIHSFDPCTACAVHAFGPAAGGSIDVRPVGGGGR
jgi:Ni,Fe-hydrogenase I large subunit